MVTVQGLRFWVMGFEFREACCGSLTAAGLRQNLRVRVLVAALGLRGLKAGDPQPQTSRMTPGKPEFVKTPETHH